MNLKKDRPQLSSDPDPFPLGPIGAHAVSNGHAVIADRHPLPADGIARYRAGFSGGPR